MFGDDTPIWNFTIRFVPAVIVVTGALMMTAICAM